MIIEDHANCIVCGFQNPLGLNLDFKRAPDGSVTALWRSTWCHQGYKGVLHGGIIATLLDGAMTHCLFQNGIRGVTCDLNIRFRKPIPCGDEILIYSRLLSTRKSLYRLESGILMRQELMAEGQARFMTISSLADKTSDLACP